MKTQGWQFSQLTGPYRIYPSQEQAFNLFASHVENIIQRDVEIYATQVVQEKKEEKHNQEDHIFLQNPKIINLKGKKIKNKINSINSPLLDKNIIILTNKVHYRTHI